MFCLISSQCLGYMQLFRFVFRLSRKLKGKGKNTLTTFRMNYSVLSSLFSLRPFFDLRSVYIKNTFDF